MCKPGLIFHQLQDHRCIISSCSKTCPIIIITWLHNNPFFHVYEHLFSLKLIFFVLWQGIYDPGQTQQKDGNQGFILLPPQPAVLPTSDAGSDGVEPTSCFVIQNSRTHYSSRYSMHGTCYVNVVCSLFTKPTLAFC